MVFCNVLVAEMASMFCDKAGWLNSHYSVDWLME